jgi:hypothetical protein
MKENGLDIGEVTALNLTKVEVSARTLLIERCAQGGVQLNVVPSEMYACE